MHAHNHKHTRVLWKNVHVKQQQADTHEEDIKVEIFLQPGED